MKTISTLFIQFTTIYFQNCQVPQYVSLRKNEVNKLANMLPLKISEATRWLAMNQKYKNFNKLTVRAAPLDPS